MENYPIDILQYIVYTLSVLIDMTLGTESVLDSQWTIVQSPNTTQTVLYTYILFAVIMKLQLLLPCWLNLHIIPSG